MKLIGVLTILLRSLCSPIHYVGWRWKRWSEIHSMWRKFHVFSTASILSYHSCWLLSFKWWLLLSVCVPGRCLIEIEVSYLWSGRQLILGILFLRIGTSYFLQLSDLIKCSSIVAWLNSWLDIPTRRRNRFLIVLMCHLIVDITGYWKDIHFWKLSFIFWCSLLCHFSCSLSVLINVLRFKFCLIVLI